MKERKSLWLYKKEFVLGLNLKTREFPEVLDVEVVERPPAIILEVLLGVWLAVATPVGG